MYEQLIEDIKVEKFELLDILHHLSSGMKATFSQITNDGMFTIRQSLGGAAYSAWSGIPAIIEGFNPTVTFEGDNTVMLQQSAKYLMKLYKRAKNGEKLTGMFEYINGVNDLSAKQCSDNSIEGFCDLDNIEKALRNISLYTIKTTIELLNASEENKTKQMNMIFALDVVKMATIHIKYINLKLTIDKFPTHPSVNLVKHGKNLACLLALTHLQEYSSIGYESGYFVKGTLGHINEAVKIMLARIRPVFIPLVEMLPVTDNQLMSAIGNSYGDIYETHLEWAKTSRLNKNEGAIPDGYMENIMPILQGKL